MSRTIATVTRPEPHDYEPDPILRGYCRTCGLPKANSVHNPVEASTARAQRAAASAEVTAAQEAHQRRTGDR